ncbi:unnamed protein product [Umbelopsis ramanniana]
MQRQRIFHTIRPAPFALTSPCNENYSLVANCCCLLVLGLPVERVTAIEEAAAINKRDIANVKADVMERGFPKPADGLTGGGLTLDTLDAILGSAGGGLPILGPSIDVPIFDPSRPGKRNNGDEDCDCDEGDDDDDDVVDDDDDCDSGDATISALNCPDINADNVLNNADLKNLRRSEKRRLNSIK